MYFPRRKSIRTLVLTSLLGLLLATLFGCSASKYGKLTPDKDVQQAFQSYQILPNHKYYYRGVYSRPVAIAGINQNYTMNLKMWVPIDAESKDFKILIDRVSLQGMGNQTEPWGSIIQDQEGHKVGIWYSAVLAAAVEVNANRQIVNLSPLTQVAIGGQR